MRYLTDTRVRKLSVSNPAIEKRKTCGADPAGENSSFISTGCVKSVLSNHFKFFYVILHMTIEEFFKNRF